MLLQPHYRHNSCCNMQSLCYYQCAISGGAVYSALILASLLMMAGWLVIDCYMWFSDPGGLAL